ncbi:phosphohistidine phosphatase SixA [Glaciecola sp. XM2]|jgi:phosphohistidine phosphatase|uniref:phosphohistidine phosphatase SixA n=1 Tax=Glaciecola sp. XM2 TaxID=1914931 RepID=UPI001BDF3014|nr:phosphohistidine phosphatase SixA [Glaciecola sp. XM2]MBT1449922.1 phosphohistidine phosphatase SixA [Glaciecola sp. XM2]
MLLIIMRHGEATPYQANDKDRELTRFGLGQADSAGKRLSKFLTDRGMNVSLEQAIVSPYIRTQQTFDALNKHVAVSHKVSADAITPMGDADAVHDLIDGYASASSPVEQLILVSHMPLVSLLADKVCLGFNGKIFDTADMLIIDYDPDSHQGTQLALYQSMN